MADLLGDIRKKYELNVGTLSEVAEQVQWLSTGNLGIDHVAGQGLPLGRSVELYGPPSSGKTSTALQTAARLQQRVIDEDIEDYILYLDHEHALDPDYCHALGLDVEHPSFLLAQPHSMEQGAEAALKLIDSGKVRLVIWDSVAAMAPIARLEGEFDQRTAAMNKARLMSGLMLQLTPLLHKHNTCAVFVNHLMESVEMSGRPGLPPKVTTPGGKALKFYASVRLEYRQIGNTKIKAVDPLTRSDVNQTNATLVKVKCTKNKVAPPAREAEVRITYGAGFDNTWSAIQVLLGHKIIRKDGAWYRFPGDLHHPNMAAGGVQGESAVLRFADENPTWRARLIDEAVNAIADRGDVPVSADENPGALNDTPNPFLFEE